MVPRGTGQVGARVRLLGRPGESEGCARVSEGWLAKKVVAWAYEPITDSRISPPVHTADLITSARVARESAKMHLRNMGYAWSSSIVSTCFLSDGDSRETGLVGRANENSPPTPNGAVPRVLHCPGR